jgi:hypothetical protein
MENYLLHENFEKRRLITKLRISDQNLLIEKEGHLKIPREKRLCQVCNQIEDEHHFLFVCNENLDLRNKYLPLIFQDRSNIGEGEKIKYILCPSSLVQVGKIGSFITDFLKFVFILLDIGPAPRNFLLDPLNFCRIYIFYAKLF